MRLQTSDAKICPICSGETRSASTEFCAACERSMDIALRQLSIDGTAVMVPVRVN